MSWQGDILNGLSAPLSGSNVAKLNAWNACEGNANGQSGLPINNPFNTTLVYGGGKSVNSAGVKWYPSWSVGLQATLSTLQSGYYFGIVANLRNDGSYSQFASAVGNSPWGTSGTCIGNTLGAGANQQQSNAPGGSGNTGTAAGNVNYTYAQLMGVWNQAGGNPTSAPMAAAIAMAESSGNASAYNMNSNGSIDRGLWQINSTHGSQSSFDVMTNARAAVAISNNGQNWRPWCTAYSDGACGSKGGSYLGQGAPYLKYYNAGVAPDLTAPINATNAAANNTGTAQNAQLTGLECSFWSTLIFPEGCQAVQAGGEAAGGAISSAGGKIAMGVVNALVGGILNPLIQIVAGVMGMTGGAILMVGGVYLMVRETQGYQTYKQDKEKVTRDAMMAAAPEAAPAMAAGGQGGPGGSAPRGRGGPGLMSPTQRQQSREQTAARRELQRREAAQARQMSTQDLLRQEAGRYGKVAE